MLKITDIEIVAMMEIIIILIFFAFQKINSVTIKKVMVANSKKRNLSRMYIYMNTARVISPNLFVVSVRNKPKKYIFFVDLIMYDNFVFMAPTSRMRAITNKLPKISNGNRAGALYQPLGLGILKDRYAPTKQRDISKIAITKSAKAILAFSSSNLRSFPFSSLLIM